MKKGISWIFVLMFCMSFAYAFEINTMPIVTVFATNSTGSFNMNVDASSTSQTFKIQPPANESWVISRMLVQIEDAANFDADRYGNNVVITNGFNITLHQNFSNNMLNLNDGEEIHTNAEWGLHSYDVAYSSYGAGSSNDFIDVRWTFSKSGAWLLLNGSTNDSIQIRLEDDFTGLVGHFMNFQGYKWTDASDTRTTEENMDTTGGISLTLFLLGIVVTLFILSSREYTKNFIANNIIKRGFVTVGFFFLSMTSVLMREIAQNTGIDTGYFLFSLMWLFGFLGYLMLGYTIVGAIFDAVKQTRMNREG